MIDQRFHFPNFNILLYSQEHIFKQASQKEGTREENRDELYKLYDRAMNLEPEGKPELTYSQRMLLNKAQVFITKRMERRQRVNTQKRNKKLMYKLSNLIQNKLMLQGGPTLSSPSEITYLGSYSEPLFEGDKVLKPIVLTPAAPPKQPVRQDTFDHLKQKEILLAKPTPPKKRVLAEQDEDEIMEINVQKKNHQKKKKRRQTEAKVNDRKEGEAAEDGKPAKKRIKIDLSQNQTREFFSHGKVATMTLPESHKNKSPSRAVIKASSLIAAGEGLGKNGATPLKSSLKSK